MIGMVRKLFCIHHQGNLDNKYVKLPQHRATCHQHQVIETLSGEQGVLL